MLDFYQYVNSLELAQLQACQQIIAETILNKSLGVSASFKHSNTDLDTESYNINDYTDYVPNFLTDSFNRDILLSELESEIMGFKLSTKINKVQNRFISKFDKPYIWESRNGPVINNPESFDNFPEITHLMNEINAKFGYKLNSVLISYYPSGNSRTRLHDDSEKCLDSSQPICILSIGAIRRIEWVDKQQESFRTAIKHLDPVDGSLYTMRAGCQERFLHRVRKNKRVREGRFCLSFRCFVEDHDVKTPSTLSDKFLDISHVQSTPAPPQPAPHILDRSPDPQFAKIDVKKSISFEEVGKVDNGYSPFPQRRDSEVQTSYSNKTGQSNDGANQRLCVLFGTSITTRISDKQLSRKGTTVVNRSESGATIQDIYESVNDFYYENINHAHRVTKVIISLGTNEIKTFNSFKYSISKFYEPLVNLVKQVKLLFPLAQIIFQSLLPIRVVFKYTAKSVHDFNELLIKVCKKYDCIFLDCFSLFLDVSGHDINTDLYWDKYHLNDRKGIKILCRAIKEVIYGNIFYPWAICNIPSYYNI